MFRKSPFIALAVAVAFLFQVVAAPLAPVMAAEKAAKQEEMSFIKGKLSSVTDIFKTLGKNAYVKYMKSSFTKNIEKIESRILEQVRSEGFEKFIADLDTLGPLGRSFADRFRNLPSEEARLEVIRKSLHQNLKAMVGRISQMDETALLNELDQTMNKVNTMDSMEQIQDLDGAPAAAGEPVIKFKSMEEMGLDGDYSEIFEKFFKGLKIVGIAGVVLLIASGGLLLSGHAAIGTVVIIAGVALAAFPVVIVVKIVRALLNSF